MLIKPVKIPVKIRRGRAIQGALVVADWKDKKVTVLGLGRSGSSAAQYLRKHGADVWLSEGSAVPAEKQHQVAELEALGIKVETGGHSDEAIQHAEFIVVSPGIPPSAPVVDKAIRWGRDVICDIELAYWDADVPIIGITGTNGKSTTCALISHLLTKAGYNAPACGNFGVPILSLLDEKPDFLVAEVSSYQLHYCRTFAPQVGVWLNLTPDHLDWHGGLNGYIEAKQKLFHKQEAYKFAVLNDDDPIVANYKPPSEVFPFSTDTDLSNSIQGAFIMRDCLAYRLNGQTHILFHKDEMKIIGKHNLENALAAVAVCAVLEIPEEKIAEGLRSFNALEHRLEYVGTVDGVKFFNDSKATNPASTIKALEAFGEEKIVLIAGGKDKGTSLDELMRAARKHVNEVILLGEAAERFKKAFESINFPNIHIVKSLEEAVDLGVKLKQGPVVLSPACASFDMFRDYEERGRVFKNLVHARLEKMAPSH